ncbi:4-phosphopantetheinyl transferase [Taibaiella sp. KBW10]|uniref:4'-phosphopantetheinyl transferase family protein n=1 Tax=Taibaiella sp. KBW10 TaxID=2153357 RepID=UPI000F5A85F9|nr:4'-phosphopantetheinyl transferase superfamily protein [Taibaiella sp. KBW10]RQO30301.1 4-phosphopantetheinyl transferase [Taibaiella sp. KBW10]
MPLYRSWQTSHAHIAIWEITETEDFFAASLGFGSDKKHPKRRLEHLSGRFLLQYLVPGFPFDKIQISPLGKPQLADQSLHFSISHSYPYAAVIVSRQQEVGIDIQVYQDKILRLQSKFLSAAEQLICANDMQRITLTWCAKEALFKYYGLGAVDFKEDMPMGSLQRTTPEDALIDMRLEKTRETCQLSGLIQEKFALSYI